MNGDVETERLRHGRREAVQTTNWSVIAAARDGDSDERRRSLSEMCETYWAPLYVYVRSRGYDTEEAKDLTQEFFALVIQERFLKNVAEEKGRFRNFLLASLNNFLANEWHKKSAKRRGGGVSVVSIDTADAESRLADLAASGRSPEDVYRRRWALDLLERAQHRLKAEHGSGNRRERFEILENYISPTNEVDSYAQLEKTSGVSSSALKVSVHRLRKRFGELVRDEIRRTVASEEDVQVELQDLLSALY